MCDWDDFEDGFEDDGFMDEDSFEDEFEADPLDEPEEPELEKNIFTARDAFFVGAIVGNAHEEALDERGRRELLEREKDSTQY